MVEKAVKVRVPQRIVRRLMELRAFNRVQFALKDLFITEGVLPKYYLIGAWSIGKSTYPITPKELMWLVASRIQGVHMTDSLLGLLRVIPNDLGILPIIADCIEEAGCSDSVFLSVLRSVDHT